MRDSRIDLAAVLRWAARLGYQQGVCNHFSLLSPDSVALFLINPEGLFWSEITASSLLLCDVDGNVVEGEGTVELSAICLHAPIHRRNKRARAVLHTHTPYATALCCIARAHVEPISLAGLQFDGKIAYDENCHGGALTPAECEREAAILGDSNVLMMRNHGPLVVGTTVAAAFDRLYYLEETCQHQLLAMSANLPLSRVKPEIAAELTANTALYDAYAEITISLAGFDLPQARSCKSGCAGCASENGCEGQELGLPAIGPARSLTSIRNPSAASGRKPAEVRSRQRR